MPVSPEYINIDVNLGENTELEDFVDSFFLHSYSTLEEYIFTQCLLIDVFICRSTRKLILISKTYWKRPHMSTLLPQTLN